MKMTLKQTLKLLTGLAVALTLTGCIEMSQEFTVRPDKTADIVIEVGMTKQVLAMAEQSGEDPFKVEDKKKLLDGAENIEKSDVKTEERGDMKYLVISVTVKDITASRHHMVWVDIAF